MSVAADIVSGFLGSGKTTLLRYVLQTGLRDARVAVIVNEIGDIGIDGRLVTGLDAVERMVEVSSGCICCSIDVYRFDIAVQEILDSVRPDLLVIEATGLADPSALVGRARNAGLRVDAVITVVDAANVARCLAETSVATTQIAAADFLVVNKTDLVDASALTSLERRLGRINRRARTFRAVRGVIDTPLLFAPGVAAMRRVAEGGATTEHLKRDDVAAFVFRTPRRLRQEAFERVVARLPGAVYRAKGIVRFVGRDLPCLFNYTCGRSDLESMDLPGVGTESQVVVIGRGIEGYRRQVLAGLTGCEAAA